MTNMTNMTKDMNEFERYLHHGKQVWTRKVLKGKHREHCLCFSCGNFKPGTDDNCERAQKLFEYCVRYDMTTPVFECPDFKEKDA